MDSALFLFVPRLELSPTRHGVSRIYLVRNVAISFFDRVVRERALASLTLSLPARRIHGN
jgi:hypothetical protein